MFIHQSRLNHLLAPSDYFDPQRYRAEIERLFLPAWHVVATLAELRRSGDYVTRKLYDQPLLVRNMDGEIHTFLNVCAHRHCQLTHQPQGHDPRLRCQYHGWEYDCEGRTGHIPEAKTFKPFERENARLTKFRTATCGELVFVSLAPEPIELRDYLGSVYDECEQSYSPPFQLAGTLTLPANANWKVLVENSLESYHIACVHASSFGQTPPEAECRHTLDERFSRFETGERRDLANRLQGWMVRQFGLPVANMYHHHHVHPNLVLLGNDAARLTLSIEPLSPTTSQMRVWVYAPRPATWRPLLSPLGRILAWFAMRATRQVLGEDSQVWNAVQEGLTASRHPGVIGTREERVYQFQEYVSQRVGSYES